MRKRWRADAIRVGTWVLPSIVVFLSILLEHTVKNSIGSILDTDSILLYFGYGLCLVPVCGMLVRFRMYDEHVGIIVMLATLFTFRYNSFYHLAVLLGGRFLGMCSLDVQHSIVLCAVLVTILGGVFGLRRLGRMPRGLLAMITMITAATSIPFSGGHAYDFAHLQHNSLQIDSIVAKRNAPQRIFWIILDEHPSFTSMSEIWHDGAAGTRASLNECGFTLYDSCRANYNYTPLSIASITNASLLPIDGKQVLVYTDWLRLSASIQQSAVMKFFAGQGYRIHWLSFFDSTSIQLFKNSLFEQTLLGMIRDRYREHMGINDPSHELFQTYNAHVADSLSRLLQNSSGDTSRQFVYAHLLMPHAPYFPAIGRHATYKLDDDDAFHHYVTYTDSIMVALLRAYHATAAFQKSNTLIILQSDHGYRSLARGSSGLRWDSNFGTLNAVLWPAKPARFSNGMTSVNTFRILLHDYWGVDITTLRDTSFNILPQVE